MSTPAGIFEPAALQGYVDAALAAIPEGKTRAFLAVATLDGVEVRYAYRVGEAWQIGVVVRKERGQRIAGMVEVRCTW